MKDSEIEAASYLEAVDQLRKARIKYAQAFLIAKARTPGMTDGHAHQVAIEETGDQITYLTAQVELFKGGLK